MYATQFSKKKTLLNNCPIKIQKQVYVIKSTIANFLERQLLAVNIRLKLCRCFSVIEVNNCYRFLLDRASEVTIIYNRRQLTSSICMESHQCQQQIGKVSK